MKQYWSS